MEFGYVERVVWCVTFTRRARAWAVAYFPCHQTIRRRPSVAQSQSWSSVLSKVLLLTAPGIAVPVQSPLTSQQGQQCRRTRTLPLYKVRLYSLPTLQTSVIALIFRFTAYFGCLIFTCRVFVKYKCRLFYILLYKINKLVKRLNRHF